MSTPANNLQSAIDELVASKTLSLDAATYVERLKLQARALGESNTRLTQENAELSRRVSAQTAEIGVVNSKLAKVDEREAAIAKREATCLELEKAAIRADATAGTFRECFGLVFRNLEMRSSMFGNAPAPTSANPNYYPPQSGIPVNETKTSTVA